VAIIGAGPAKPVDGMTLALACAAAGFDTVLEDVLPGNLRQAVARLPQAIPHGLRFAHSIEDAVRDVDLVIDTVPDELESKLEILSLLDRMAPPAALFATPTDTLSIADLASCTYRAGQCCGLRIATDLRAQTAGGPWAVRVSWPPQASESTRSAVSDFFHALGAQVEQLQDNSRLP
jgi:3-hydroxybutyryl-CoA dehydrogenase